MTSYALALLGIVALLAKAHLTLSLSGSSALELAVAIAVLVWLVVWLAGQVLPRRLEALEVRGQELLLSTRWVGFRRRRRLQCEHLRHLELSPARSGEAPWTLALRMREGTRVCALSYSNEVEARAALAQLGRRLKVPVVVVVEKSELATSAEEIGRPLWERAEARTHALPERPGDTDLLLEEGDTGWTLRYPAASRGLRWALLALVLLPACLFVGGTWAMKAFAASRAAWLTWALLAALLCSVIYLLVIVQREFVARLAGARVELANGQVRFHSPEDKIAQVPLAAVESVEPSRWRGLPSIAVVTASEVLHIRDLFSAEERAWVRAVLVQAVITAQERQASALVVA